MAEERQRSFPVYSVDAFTNEPFHGNPAAVCLLPRSMNLSTELLQTIAAEINLTETAFLEHESDDSTFDTSDTFKLRWFTPTDEIELCGHATLASAAVLMFCCGNKSETICFNSMKGPLTAIRKDDMITLDFPLNPTTKMEYWFLAWSRIPLKQMIEERSKVKGILKALCDESIIQDVQYSSETKKLLVRVKDSVNRQEFETLTPDYRALEDADTTGNILEVILTLKGSPEITDKTGKPYDFVSRNFSPWVGIPEDPVTGSAHTVLADYWQKELGVSTFYARQCSARGGEMTVTIIGDRVELTGQARVILKGEMFI